MDAAGVDNCHVVGCQSNLHISVPRQNVRKLFVYGIHLFASKLQRNVYHPSSAPASMGCFNREVSDCFYA